LQPQLQLQLAYEPKHFEGYPNGLDYVACFRRHSGFCSIAYSHDQGTNSFDIGSNDVGSSFVAAAASASDYKHHAMHSSDAAQSDCANSDFLAIGASKFCSAQAARSSMASTRGFNLTSRPITFSASAAAADIGVDNISQSPNSKPQHSSIDSKT